MVLSYVVAIFHCTQSFAFQRLPIPAQVSNQVERIKLDKGNLFRWFFPRGFSSNTVLLLWSLFGGVLFHALLSNFLKMLMMPMWEEPVDTAQDVLDRGLIPVVGYGEDYLVQQLKNSQNTAYQKLGEITIMADDNWDRVWDALRENGTHVFLQPDDGNGDYHGSKETVEGRFSWLNWISDKKWHFKEDLAKHILIYQQVSEYVTQNYY